MPTAITDIAPKKLRKMLKKGSQIVIFDSFVHMSIDKGEGNIWRFFDTLNNKERFETFYNNMVKTLKACRVHKIRHQYGDGEIFQTTNINDYIAEFLDTTDVDELVSKLLVIDEEQLGDIKLETRYLISNARKKVMAYLSCHSVRPNTGATLN
jgi:hypothetical protein